MDEMSPWMRLYVIFWMWMPWSAAVLAVLLLLGAWALARRDDVRATNEQGSRSL